MTSTPARLPKEYSTQCFWNKRDKKRVNSLTVSGSITNGGLQLQHLLDKCAFNQMRLEGFELATIAGGDIIWVIKFH